MNKGPEEALIYSKLFWPDLIEVDGFVFLAENYDREYYDQVVRDYGASQVEETINTTYLYNLVGGKGEYDTAVWEALGNTLCSIWKSRVRRQFPDKKVVVLFSWYTEIDDPGITLYQA